MSPKPQLVSGSWWGNEWAFYRRGIVAGNVFSQGQTFACQMRSWCQLREQILLFITIHVLSVELLSECVFVCVFVGAPNLQGCFVKTALKGNYHHHLWRKSSHHPLFLTPPRVIANVLAHLQPKIYSFPFHGRLSPPPYWCVSQRTQGWCLTEPWMLFSCHTFPKRLAAAPIVATEGGLLSWSFRPPAVALVSDGSTVRERGPNNGQRLDVMLLMRARSLRKYMVGFHCMEQIDREISDLPVGLELRGTLQMFFSSRGFYWNCLFP